MSLQGSIETFAVADVLRLLAATSKTGRLHVQGPTRAGTVWVRSAQILGAESASSPYAVEPADVVFQLLRFERGSFRFELGEVPVEEVSPVDIEVVLAEAETMLGEWRDLEARIASPRSWVTLQPELRSGAVTLSPDEWTAVVTISVGRTVAELGAQLELGELHTARVVARLLDLGLVEVGEAPPAPVGSDLPAPPVPVYDDAAIEPVGVMAGSAPVRETAPSPTAVPPAAAAALAPSPYAPADPGYAAVAPVVPALGSVAPQEPVHASAAPGHGLADTGYGSVDDGYLPPAGSVHPEPESAWFVASVAPSTAPDEDLYAYPGLADLASTPPAVAPPTEWLPVAAVPTDAAQPGPAGDAAWIGSLAEAIEQVGPPATWTSGAEPDQAEAWAAVASQPPVAPVAPSPLAPVGSFGGPTSLFKSGPPERLAPPPPPPPARFDAELTVGAGTEGAEAPAAMQDADLEQQLFNLSPRARQAIKQSAGLQQGFNGR